MNEREKIAAIIRALRAKTVENGCTEDEAIAAAAKIVELLARYNLTVDEVEMRASPFKKHKEVHYDPVGERVWKPAVAIAKLTGCTTWKSGPGVHPAEIYFFGFEHEVEIAKYLLEVCAGAMRREQDKILVNYRRLAPAMQRRRVAPFLDGMADRLYRRILELIPPTPTGTGLVVLRNALLAKALKDTGVALKKTNARPSLDYDPAYGAGRRAADKVALNPALGGSGAIRALLG
jgi:hypothetical protein